MPESSEHRDYRYVMDLLRSGDVADFEALCKRVENFPDGVDGFIGRRWIINALDCDSVAAVNWMLSRKVDLAFRDEEGYTPLLTVIDGKKKNKYALLRALLEAGAPVNMRGINEFTPAHLAAIHNDVEALRMLAIYSADFTIRTTIDDYATPLEEAERCEQSQAITFLRTMA